MARLKHAGDFRDLLVYQNAFHVAAIVFDLTRSFPKEEAYSLTDQIRRASRAIGAQIAEAWAKRRYEKHFVSKLTDADAEQRETQHWVDTARACGYLSAQSATELVDRLSEIGRMLGGMMDKSHLFCTGRSDTVHEAAAPYFVREEDEP